MNPWPKEDVRYTATLDEEIEEIKLLTREDLAEFHADFYGASYGELGIVGDIDPEEATALASQLFDDWKNATPYERLTEEFSDRPAVIESIEVPDKESAVFRAGTRVNMRDDNPDYPAMVLGNFMTGGGFLNSRLATRIRRTDGLSYGVGSFFYADAWDEVGAFGAFAIYAPQNDAKLITAFEEEIQRVLDSGFADEEIAEAKSGWLQSREVSRSQERELVGALARRQEQGRTLAWDALLETKIAELTNTQILEAFRKYIDLKKISIVRAGNFAGAAEKAAAVAERAD